MDSILQIPDYYYDEEKKKLFKLQFGTPASCAYSPESIKRRKLREAHTEAESAKTAAQRGRIKRSTVLTQGISGQHLLREQGKTNHVTISKPLADSLVPYHRIHSPFSFGPRGPIFNIETRADLGSSVVDYHMVQTHGFDTERADVSAPRNSPSGGKSICERIARRNCSGTPTSLSIHQETRYKAITYCHNNYLAYGVELWPMDNENPTTSLYTSTPANAGSSLLFAIGSSHGILTIDKRNLDMNWVTPNPISTAKFPKMDECPRDVFALEFLQEKEAVLLSGGRRGLLYTHDLKAPGIGRKSADVIYHPSTVTHVKQLNPYRILVAGLESSLYQYDLRYLKREAYPSASYTKLNKRSTRPILEYPDYFNTASILHGFDVDLETGVIVIGQEQNEQHPSVGLFSLEGGHVLPSSQLNKVWWPRWPFANHHSIRPPPHCLKFVRDIEHRSKSLYVGGEDGIHRFVWAGEDEGEVVKMQDESEESYT